MWPQSIQNMQRFITIIILIFALNSCNLLGDGENTLIKESSNKKQNKKAILFLRQMSTSGDSYQITVSDNDENFDKNEPGNTFTVDEDHGKAQLDSLSINLNWLADDTLQIDYDEKLRTFIKRKEVENVTIVYKAR